MAGYVQTYCFLCSTFDSAKAHFLVGLQKESLSELTYNELHLIKKESFAITQSIFKFIGTGGICDFLL